jgi:hypothetical protein
VANESKRIDWNYFFLPHLSFNYSFNRPTSQTDKERMNLRNNEWSKQERKTKEKEKEEEKVQLFTISAQDPTHTQHTPNTHY